MNTVEQMNKKEAARLESRVLGIAGAILLGLAGFFAWRELQVQAEVLLIVGAAAAAIGAFVARRARVPLLGPALLLGATVLGAGWYGATREPILLGGVLLSFAAAVGFAVKGQPGLKPGSSAERWHRFLSWHGVAVSGLLASLAVYFQLFDASDLELQGFVARRAVLSLGWLVAGVLLVIAGRSRRATEIRDSGFVFVAAALSKLVAYDILHLEGAMRIGTLALGGAVLLAAAAQLRRVNREVTSS